MLKRVQIMRGHVLTKTKLDNIGRMCHVRLRTQIYDPLCANVVIEGTCIANVLKAQTLLSFVR